MRHIIAVLLENEAGALSRVVGLFSQRNFNIETLTVAPTEDPTLSRLTVTTSGSDRVIEQITKQLNKLIEVVKLVDLTEGEHIEREMMLIKLKATGQHRDEVKRTVDIFRGQIVDVTSSIYTVQLIGDQGKLDGFISAIGEAYVLETVRTGVSGIGRGDKVLSVQCDSGYNLSMQRAVLTAFFYFGFKYCPVGMLSLCQSIKRAVYS